jgi:hypothetical protein
MVFKPVDIREHFRIDYTDADGKRHRITVGSKTTAQAEYHYRMGQKYRILAERHADAMLRELAKSGARGRR